MKYFFDTEFIDGAWGLTLISIGVCAEDGREFYAISNQYNGWDCSPWVKENVLSKMQPMRSPIAMPKSLAEIRTDLLSFIGDDVPEFWAYYGAHDWAALTWLMGGMMNMPKGWPMICREARTSLPETVKDEGRADEHNALADARWVREKMRFWIVPNPAALTRTIEGE